MNRKVTTLVVPLHQIPSEINVVEPTGHGTHPVAHWALKKSYSIVLDVNHFMFIWEWTWE